MGSSQKKSKKKKKTDSSKSSSDHKKTVFNNDSLPTTITPPLPIAKIETNPTPLKLQTQPSSNATKRISQFSSWGQAFQAAASIKPHDLGDDYVDPSTTLTSQSLLDGDEGERKVKWGSGDVFGVSRIAVECINKQQSEELQTKEVNMEVVVESKKRSLEDVIVNDTGETMESGDAKNDLEDTKPPKKKSKKKHKKEKKKKKKQDREEEGEVTTHDSETDDIVPDESGSQELEGKMITHQNQSMMVLIDKVKKLVYSGVDRSEDGNLIKIGHVHGDTIKIDIPKDAPIKPTETEQGTFHLTDENEI